MIGYSINKLFLLKFLLDSAALILASSQHLRLSFLLKLNPLCFDYFLSFFQEVSIFLSIQVSLDFNATSSCYTDQHFAHLLHGQECIARILDLYSRNLVQMLQCDFTGDFLFRVHGTPLYARCLFEEERCWRLMDDKLVGAIGVRPNLKINTNQLELCFQQHNSYAAWKRNAFFDFLSPLVEILAKGSDVDTSLTELRSKRWAS